MAVYEYKPLRVQGFQITEILKCEIERTPDGKRDIQVRLDNGQTKDVPPEMTSRMVPVVGDYWVIQPDGYEYLNPKHVFEGKFIALTDGDDQAPEEAA